MQDSEIIQGGRARGLEAAPASLPTSWLRKGSLAASRTISPDFVVVCLFSLLGLALCAATLSYFSEETVGMCSEASCYSCG
jgi:hypothetical protein